MTRKTKVPLMVKAFFNELGVPHFEKGTYIKRAHLWRGYKTYLDVLGVARSQSPVQFYIEALIYLNFIQKMYTFAIPPPTVRLEEHKNFDVFMHVCFPNFEDNKYQLGETLITEFLESGFFQ